MTILYQQIPNILHISQSLPSKYSSSGFDRLSYSIGAEIADVQTFMREVQYKLAASYDCGNIIMYFNKPDVEFEQLLNKSLLSREPWSFLINCREKPDLYFTGCGLEVNKEWPSGIVEYKLAIGSDIYSKIPVAPLMSKRVRDW